MATNYLELLKLDSCHHRWNFAQNPLHFFQSHVVCGLRSEPMAKEEHPSKPVLYVAWKCFVKTIKHNHRGKGGRVSIIKTCVGVYDKDGHKVIAMTMVMSMEDKCQYVCMQTLTSQYTQA